MSVELRISTESGSALLLVHGSRLHVARCHGIDLRGVGLAVGAGETLQQLASRILRQMTADGAGCCVTACDAKNGHVLARAKGQ
jgi:hypothetical protein